MRSFTLFGLIALCMLVLSGTANGQGFGRIVGTVTDANGAVVGNAKVTATQVGKNQSRTASADSSGYYVLDSLHFDHLFQRRSGYVNLFGPTDH